MPAFESTGSHADAFAEEHLFRPLGITTWDWENNRYEGHPAMAGTLKICPRDMAKIGQLVLDEGVWSGEQVVSAEWIRESTRTHIVLREVNGYGYLWWGFDELLPGGVVYAMGLGSQYIFVVPSLDMVVATTAGNDYNRKDRAILRVAEQHLLPGISP